MLIVEVNVTLVLLQAVELAVAMVTTGATAGVTVTVTPFEVAETIVPQADKPVITQLNTSLLAIEDG